MEKTIRMREKGKERLDVFARIELYFALKRIHRWNYWRPRDKGAEILLKYEETADKLKALGYKLFYTGRDKGKRSWYDIDWEWD